MKITFKVQLKIIWFFTNTLIGYALFVFLFIYGFFGCLHGECMPSNSISALIATVIIYSTLELYILVKIPFTREYLENLLGKDFIIAHLGQYT